MYEQNPIRFDTYILALHSDANGVKIVLSFPATQNHHSCLGFKWNLMLFIV